MMRRPRQGALAAASLLLAASLCSCGIRLPIETRSIRRIEVSQDREQPRRTAPESSTKTTSQPPEVLVWLVADSYHTGMVFPYDWLIESGFIPPAGFPAASYVNLSWGNRDAYSEAGIDSPAKWARVLFTPTPSVMELIPIDWHVAEVLPHQRIWRKLARREQGPQLARFLNECTVHDESGRPRVVTKSSWGHGVQLESRHHYFIPRVCNIWTAQAIECLGGQMNPWLSISANGLARQAENPANGFELIWPGGGSAASNINP